MYFWATVPTTIVVSARVTDQVKKLQKSRRGAQRRTAPTEVGTVIAAGDAARYAGAHPTLTAGKGHGACIQLLLTLLSVK
jgi:hypothetical protein